MKKFMFVLMFASVFCLALGLTACNINGGKGDNGGNGGEGGGSTDVTDPSGSQTPDVGKEDGGETFDHVHAYTVDNVCSVCGDKWEYTEGLVFTLDTQTDTYVVSGIGDVLDDDISIPCGYQGRYVTAIGESAFENCEWLKTVMIPNTITSIGDWAFDNCDGLTNITIPDSVTSIRYGAFADCIRLTSIIIPNSVVTIGRSAFSGCSGLESVYYKGTPDEWDEIEIDSDNIELASAKRYYYSAEENYDGLHWHYDPETGEPVVWTKEND